MLEYDWLDLVMVTTAAVLLSCPEDSFTLGLSDLWLLQSFNLHYSEMVPEP